MFSNDDLGRLRADARYDRSYDAYLVHTRKAKDYLVDKVQTYANTVIELLNEIDSTNQELARLKGTLPRSISEATHYAMRRPSGIPYSPTPLIEDAYIGADDVLWLWSSNGWNRTNLRDMYRVYPRSLYVRAERVNGAEVLIKREFIETPGRD